LQGRPAGKGAFGDDPHRQSPPQPGFAEVSAQRA
jgi:hypothetical protein